MSSDDRLVFTKDNIDTYLKALAKEYRKLGGRRLPAEIVLIGGASLLPKNTENLEAGSSLQR